MRYLKKSNFKELELTKIASKFKEIELCLSEDDMLSLDEKLKKIENFKKIYNTKIKAIHWSVKNTENTENTEGYNKFISIYNFAKEIYNINNKFELKVQESKENLEENLEEENLEPVYIIMPSCYLNINEIINKLNDASKGALNDASKGASNDNNFRDSLNVGVCVIFEDLKLAKELNEKANYLHDECDDVKDNIYFGASVDFYNILEKLNNNSQKNILEYFENIEEEDKKLIRIFHLSNYKNGLTGKEFNNYNQRNKVVLEDIKEILQEYNEMEQNKTQEILVTIEESNEKSISETNDLAISEKNFNNIILLMSKIHTKLKNHIDDDLYIFFDYLYYIYSNERISLENSSAEFDTTLHKIRNYIYENSKDNKILMYQLHNEQDTTDTVTKTIFDEDIDINLFQIKSYIYYMRFVNLAFRLINEKNRLETETETEQDTDKISKIMKFYIFQDSDKELVFDGLMGYFHVYWLPDKSTLFHLYDGIDVPDEYEKNYEKNNEEFNFNRNILAACRNHINGTNNGLKLLSTGKSFLYCMCKYFNPDLTNSDDKTTLEIYPNVDINYALLKDENGNHKQISLQELRLDSTINWLKQNTAREIINYSIDFSSFYGGRVGDASLNELFTQYICNENEEIGKGIARTKVASIKDKEVVLLNKSNLKPKIFKLTRIEFIFLMFVYKYILFEKNYVENLKKFENIENIECKKNALKEYINNYWIEENKNNLINNIIDIIDIMNIDNMSKLNINDEHINKDENKKMFNSYLLFLNELGITIPENNDESIIDVTENINTKINTKLEELEICKIIDILSYIDFNIDSEVISNIEYEPYTGNTFGKYFKSIYCNKKYK